MNRKSIEHAKDPDLRGSVAAIRRAARRARLVALNTGTKLVVARSGSFVLVTPTVRRRRTSAKAR